MNWFFLMRKQLLNQYLQFESESLRLPELLIITLRIQKAFLSLSYICAKENKKYYYLFALFARPQLEIQLNYISYLVVVFNLYYLLNILVILPGRQYVALYGNLLRMTMLNILYDYSNDLLLAQISLVFIVVIDSLFVRGNLNIQTKNFQIIKNTILDYCSTLIHLLMMIFYDINPFIGIIIAYINCIFIILNQYLNSPYQSKQMIINIISIQLVTLYWGICNTQDFTDILLVPFILKIINQFIINNCNKTVVNLDDLLYNYKDSNYQHIQIPQSSVDKVVYASILIQQNQTFQAITILYKIKDLNFIDEGKKQIVYQICLKKIDLFIHANVTAQQGITESVKQMMKSEDQNYSIYFEIKNIVYEKLKILQHISQNIVNFKKVKLFLQKLLNLQQRLEDYYHIYPCDKSQRVLGFFYGEIINDYLAAHRLFSIITMSDEKMKVTLQHSNVFSNKMVYIISNYEHGLIVKRVSNNIQLLLHQQDIINQPITNLVPQGVQQWHETLVQDFFTKGYSRYLRNLGENYILQNNCITNLEFAVDVNLTDNLNFIAFLQPSMSQQLVIIVDKTYTIASESESLIKLVKVSVIGVQMQSVYSKVRDIHIDYLENVNVKFNRFTYQTSFSIRKKFIRNEFAYMIIVFDFLKKLQNMPTQVSLMPVNEMIMGEDQDDSDIYKEEKFEIPYDYDEEFIQISNLEQYHTIKVLSPSSSIRQQLILYQTPRYFCKEQTERQPSEQVQNSQIYLQKQNIEIIEDQQSQVSSLAGMRNSKFFPKYDIVNKVTKINPYSKYHKMFIAFNILNIVIQMIICIIGLVTLNNGLLSLASNIDLLQIKNFAFQPLESFLLTRWTILDYSNLYKANSITLDQFNSIVKFPRSNLALGYDSLSKNINSLLNKKELQTILNNKYLDIYQYTDTHTDQYYNLTLRNSVNILLEYQYTLKMVYLIDGAAVIDSPYIFYSYKNYNVLKTTFSEINQETLNDSLAISITRQQSVKNAYIISILLLFFITILIIYYNLKIQKKYINILLSLKKCKQYNFEEELIRYHHLHENLGKNQNELFRYQFSLEYKETQLSDQVYQKSQCNFQSLEISSFKTNCLIILVYLIIGIITSITFLQAENYLGKFPQTAIFYKALSDVGTDVPTMYAQKEVLYGKSVFPYLNQTDFDIVLNEIVQAIERIKLFNKIEHNDLLVSNAFKEYYAEIESGNLCNFVSKDIQAKSKDLCPIVMNQNLLLGFQSLLVSMVNSVEKEMAINNFTTRLTLPYLEFEGAFIVSDIIHEINSVFNQDLFEQTTQLLSVIEYYNIAMLVLMIIYLIFIYIYLRNSIQSDYRVIQRLMYIIPIKCLYCDEVFERYLRYLLVESMRD